MAYIIPFLKIREKYVQLHDFYNYVKISKIQKRQN